VPARQPDDLGKGDSSEIGTQGKTSETTGNAGARLACGVIGLCA
jgi:Cu-Zn family superoxide dismutase